MRKLSRTSDLSREAIERIAKRYEGRFLQGYARGKLRSDPAYQAAFRALGASLLPVLDLGCGIGLFACYARECGGRMALLGVDLDERKIAQARRGTAEYEDVRLRVGEAATEEHAGHVLLLDVLHYLPREAQIKLVHAVVAAVAPGGCCVIRTTLRDPSWRFRFNRVAEWGLQAVGWMRHRAGYYPGVEELSGPFLAAGFGCESGPLRGRTPFNSHLLIFRRPEQG